MIITKATKEDLSEILQLQYLSYQSEAKLLNNFDIPPLKQTLQEVQNEYDNGTRLKVLDDNNRIIGSVRGYIENGTLYIGKLFVHPFWQGKGIGTKLLKLNTLVRITDVNCLQVQKVQKIYSCMNRLDMKFLNNRKFRMNLLLYT